MKKKLLSFLSVVMISSGFVVNAQYCEQGPTSTADSNIEEITATGENTTSLNYTGCPGVLGVEDLTTEVIDFIPGQSYSIDVTFGTCGSDYDGAGEAWIDFDGDEVFDPVTESIGASTGTPGTAPWDAAVTFNFTVPLTAVVGTTRMRVMQEESGTLPLDPCSSYSWGSVIDFSVNILPDAPPTPDQDAAAPTCATGTDLTLAGTPAAGIEWYWQGTDPLGTSTVDDGTQPLTVFTNGTYYARAYDPIADVWSVASSIVISNIPVATAPPAPIASANPACVTDGSELTMDPAPAGTEYYWQGTTMNGTSTADPATSPYSVSASGTYYVAAFETASGCWSETTGIAVTIDTDVPNTPIPVESEVTFCTTDDPMNIEVVNDAPACEVEVTISSASWGDATTWELTDNGGTVVLSGGTYGNGYSDTQTLPSAADGPYELTITSTSFDNSPDYTVSVGGSVAFSGTATADDVTVISGISCPGFTGTTNWYSDLIGGTNLGSGEILNALGTSVLPTATSGEYTFYVAAELGACQSTRDSVVVTVSDINLTLNAIDETCTGTEDGSFEIGTVLCGSAPFSFSVDGGAFGPAPNDLTPGSYAVVVEDNAGNQTNPINIVVGTNATTIPDNPVPVDSIYYFCTSDDPMNIEVEEQPVGCPIEITVFSASWGDATTWEVTDNGGNVVLSGGTYGNGYSDTQTIPAAANGPYTLTITSTLGDNTPEYSVSVDGVVVESGVGTTDGVTNVAPFSCPPGGGDINWYSDAAGTDFLGMGEIFNVLGTSVIPTATPGEYEFYAQTDLNGCLSGFTLVEAVVSNVNVLVEGIAATCNGSATGSFVVTDTLCGLTPFTYSVDGGTFESAISTDLLPGTHTVVVQDDNGDQSAEYTITVNDALEPSDLVMVDITDDGGQVSWNANGDETEWNVEWGLSGYTPGTGNEAGSDVVSDTFAIITGLDSNEDYDFYVSANCGAGSTPSDSSMISFTTDCGIYGLPFVETFENDSETRVCWTNEYVDGSADWTYQTGSSGGNVTTAYEGDLNARFVSQSGDNSPITKLVSPRFDLTGQDSVALIFAHAEEVWAGDQNETKVYTLGSSAGAVWDSISFYNGPDGEWTVDTLFIADTTLQIAFEGINNWGRANVVDDIQMWPCTLTPGVDGEEDVCRLDGTFNLNSIVTLGEDFGRWEFTQNPSVLNDSVVTVSALPEGTFEFLYIVETPCATDTTVALLNIYPPSSAGQNGSLEVCRNEPVNLYDGLGGNVDLGGTWYDPTNTAIAGSQPMASNFGGSYNYDYITSNGVCPADTALVEVIVDGNCDWLSLGEEKMNEISVFPNPATDVINIANPSNSESLRVEMLDMNGRVVLTDAKALANATEGSIDVSHLVKGMYTLRVYNEDGQKTFKVVIQ